MNEGFAIAIHGGAGTINKESLTQELIEQYGNALQEALQTGINILQYGGCSLDAVEAAVIALEDCPLFNAGRGSVLNSMGNHEMDAAIMDGSTLAAAAVAGVSGIKNPIHLARAIMDKTDYVFLCGKGAGDFAREQGFPFEQPEYFYTDFRYCEWKKKQEAINQSIPKKFGTVGAVALDKTGNLAAATSTGGISDKKYGRIGDSPVIGAGTYANNHTCAVSCTGQGEQFIRSVVAYDISCLIEYKQLSLQAACAYALQRLEKINGSGGLIAIDRHGQIQMPFNTEGMYRACFNMDRSVEIKIFG